MRENINIIQDISLLYELSLAVGKSLDVTENCDNFLKVLMARKGLSFASVWLRENEYIKSDTDNTVLVYAAPQFKVQDKIIENDHFIYQQLKKQKRPYWLVPAKNKHFNSIIQEKDIEGGCFAIYPLEDIGYLKLYSINENTLSTIGLEQLVNVIQKFALILKGSLVYLRLKNETYDRIRAQKALQASEERYSGVVNSLAEGIIITDLEGRVTYVNPQMCKLTGYSSEQLLGEKAYKLLLRPEKQKDFEANFEKRKKGISENYEIEHVRPNKEIWIASINAIPFKDAQGNIIGAMGAVMDITVRKKAEQRIQESEYKFRKIVDTSLDAVVTVNKKSKITEWNEQAEITFGYTREEALGQTMMDLIMPPRFRDAHNKGMTNYFKTGHGPVLNNRIEIFAIDRNNREFPIELSINEIILHGEHFFSAFIRDITERKQAEEKILAAQKAAEKARLAEQQFLANMSHEIRTPINAVVGMTHLLYSTPLNDTQKEYIDALRYSSESLMGIVNNILDISKIEAGKLEFEQKEFSLESLLKGLNQTFQFRMIDKDLTLDISFDKRIENYLVGDPTRLKQVLFNLLGNAFKFTSEGSIGIHTMLLAQTSDTFTIQFDVFDTGIGIASDKLDTIFESFKQADVSVTRKYGGTGLGLAIVKQLVERQGGSIHVRSQVGRGSNFMVTLPFGNSGMPIDEDREQGNYNREFRDSERIKKIKFLIVEDNEMNQKLVQKILSNWGCQYDLAENGKIAVQKSLETTYDIILMDVHMPEMDGFTATSTIRNNPNNPNKDAHIIALTAAAFVEEKNKAKEVGMNNFLTKPFSPVDLASIIQKVDVSQKDNSIPEVATEEAQLAENPIPQVDLSKLEKLVKNDPSFMEDMISIFLKDIPVTLKEMDTALQNEEWQTVCDLAHKIKSNFMLMGMTELHETAFRIESMIRSKSIHPESVQSDVQYLMESTNAVMPVLKAELKKTYTD